MRRLKDIKKERENKTTIKKERAEYRKSGSIPISHWSSLEMYYYFMEVKEGTKWKINQRYKNHERTMYSAMAAIKQSGLNGTQFVELVKWSENRGDLSTIWNLIKSIPSFKKVSPDVFEEDVM